MLLRALFFGVFCFCVCDLVTQNLVTVEFSKNDANLLTREVVFIFISKKLVEIDSEIGNEMLVALRRR
jgi:hypothetical protein